MTWLFVLLAVAVIAGVIMASVGRLGELPAAEPDLRPDVVDGVPEFDVVLRGYRMDEVDAELDRLTTQIEQLRSVQQPPESDGS